MKFVPEKLEVAAGDVVTWVNQDLVPHTVTMPGAAVESGAIAPGAGWKLVAQRPGEMRYVCRFHPTMKAVLLVK